MLDMGFRALLTLVRRARRRAPGRAIRKAVPVLLLIDQERGRLGSVRRHRAVSHRPVIVGNLVPLLGRVVAVRLVVLRAVVAHGQVPVALQPWRCRNEVRGRHGMDGRDAP